MHYIKYDVNSSLLTYFWLLQKVCGTLDHCFITTHIIHNEGDILQIYFCVIFCETRNHAQAHVTSGTNISCTLSLAVRRTHMAAEVCWRFCWPVFMIFRETRNHVQAHVTSGTHISCTLSWPREEHTAAEVFWRFRWPVFVMTFRETRNYAQAHVTSGTHISCMLSLATRRTHTAAEDCWRFRWPVFVMATLESQNICCGRTWSSNQSGGGAILALSSFDVCWGLLLLLLLLLLLFNLSFLLKILFKIASLRTRFRVGVSNQKFGDSFSVKFYFFNRPLQ